MNANELRKLLEKVPDDALIVIHDNNGFQLLNVGAIYDDQMDRVVLTLGRDFEWVGVLKKVQELTGHACNIATIALKMKG